MVGVVVLTNALCEHPVRRRMLLPKIYEAGYKPAPVGIY
jgi:hypothetical protein